MSRQTKLLTMLIAVALSPPFQSGLAQNSNVGWTGINGGGGVSGAGNSRVASAIGQPLVGSEGVANAHVTSGFLAFKQSTGPLNLYSVMEKWNLISVPLTMSDYTRSVIYPSAVSNAFYFDAGYFASPVLENGIGYWLKFDADQVLSLSGGSRSVDTIDVIAGWNMIGTLSTPIAASGVGSIPGGIVTSNFFQFSGLYESSTTLEPGKGYWVKVTQPGKLVLSAGGTMESQNRIRIVEMDELPPPPTPEGGGR
jgi:hypothetical protein